MRLVHQDRASVRVTFLENYALPGRKSVHVPPKFLVELDVGGSGYNAVGHHLRAERESLVDPLPHGTQSCGAKYQGRAVLRVADAKLAQQFGADEGLAESDHVAYVAAAMRLHHGEAAAYGVGLEVGQFHRSRNQRQGRGAYLGAVEFSQRLEIDMVRRRLGERPGAFQLRHERVAYILGIRPQGVEPASEFAHLGVAGDSRVEFGIALEPGEREVGRAYDCGARFGVAVVPAQVRLGVERVLEVGADFHAVDGYHVAQAGDGGFGVFGLGQRSDALGYVGDRPLRYLGALSAPHHVVGFQTRLEGVGLSYAERDLFQDAPVGPADEDADLVQPGQVVRHRVEAGHEEVADRDVRARRTAQHLFEPG